MSETTAVAITLIIIFVLWVLFVLFVKPSYTGDWVSSKNKVYMKHNKFTDKIEIYEYGPSSGMLSATPTIARACGELIIFNEAVKPMYAIYDKSTDTINPVANVTGESIKRQVVLVK